MTNKQKVIIELDYSGDSWCGFRGIESKDNGRTWYYRGDVGVRPRQWWRDYCRRMGYVLREV